jgi:glycosyltransferase involved in cell wall biosynthesis
VASSDPHKNVERLLDAFARFRQRHPSGAAYRLYVMGAWMGRREQRLHARITRLGLESAVRHLTGVPTRHVAALYSGAQALVFPSLMEGFGLPVLEAMASGTPVIAANGSSLPEITGDAALLVDPYDVEALTEAIWRLAEDAGLRAALIARGQARSRQFSWERLARETVAIYRMAGGGVRVGVQAGGTRALGPYGTA